jgi:hypothetical protein
MASLNLLTTMKTKTIFLLVSIFMLVYSNSLGYSELVIVSDSTTATPPFKERISTQNSTIVSKPKQQKTNVVALIGGIAGLLSLLLLLFTAAIAFQIGLALALTALVMGMIGKTQVNVGKGKGWGWAKLAVALGGILPFAYCFVWALRALFGAIS